MSYIIKCDQMADGWNYDTCIMCRCFSHSVSPRRWKCRLNNGTAAERRTFRMIWANEFLRAHEMSLRDDDITVEYVGKKRKK